MSVSKNEQAKVLYEAIERQQMKITLQQQIIACLEFRHALEELPNMTSTMQLPPRPAHGHAGAWKRTWRLAVECELDEMIRTYIKPSIKNSVTEEASTELPASASEEAPAEPPIPANVAPRNARLSLRELLKFDFDNWAKGSALLKEARRTKTVSKSGKPKGRNGEVQEVANNGYSCGLSDSNLFDLPDGNIEAAGSLSIVETKGCNITGDEDTAVVAHTAGTTLGTADSTNFIESTGTTAAVEEIKTPSDYQTSPDIASNGVPASAEISVPKATTTNDTPSAEDTTSATGTKRESNPRRR
ncbi:hypothetical protein IQ07DRAFT_644112 [Pyrenochaeta sp. DS3sAY3a]|nr:hypothetical protein IQ07DRAFT_644112 [Pyrenochaeta sp. DS3sAY3a]